MSLCVCDDANRPNNEMYTSVECALCRRRGASKDTKMPPPQRCDRPHEHHLLLRSCLRSPSSGCGNCLEAKYALDCRLSYANSTVKCIGGVDACETSKTVENSRVLSMPPKWPAFTGNDVCMLSLCRLIMTLYLFMRCLRRRYAPIVRHKKHDTSISLMVFFHRWGLFLIGFHTVE